MATKLTEYILIGLGFRGEGKGITGNPLYRLKIPYDSKTFEHGYYFELQMEFNPHLPDTNGNSGILSIYRPTIKDCHMVVEETDKLKADYVQQEIPDRGDGKPSKLGIKYIDHSGINMPIAHHVTTVERLNAIYTSLTRNKPLKERKIKKLTAARKAEIKKYMAKTKARRNK